MRFDRDCLDSETARPSPVARVLIGLVRVYQSTLSPFIGGQCKFLPTCSEYTIEALRSRGAVVGLGLGIWRILRCNPFSRGGYDPVPPRSSDR